MTGVLVFAALSALWCLSELWIGLRHRAADRSRDDRTLVRLVHAEVAALRTLPTFGNQTEPLTRLADLIDQMRRQLHMSGADAEEDATGN